MLLSVVRTPAATVVASVPSCTAKAAVVAASIGILLLLLLMASAALVAQSSEAAILAALTASLQVAGIAAEALLMRLLRNSTLSALAGAVVCCGSRSAGLRSEGGGTGSGAFVAAKRLQRVFVATLLTSLLLAI